MMNIYLTTNARHLLKALAENPRYPISVLISQDIHIPNIEANYQMLVAKGLIHRLNPTKTWELTVEGAIEAARE